MLDCFRIFVDLVESGSFSRAAAANYLTQSAVSQRIQTLESELGHELLVRGHGHVTPTEAGRLFYQVSVEILDRYARGLDELHSLRDVVSGQLRVGAVNSIGLYVLPPFVEEFLRRCPGVDLDVEFLHSNEIHVRVIESTLDLGLVAFPTRSPQVSTTVFRYDDLVLVVPPDHSLAGETEVKPARLDGEAVVSFEAGNPTRRAIEHRFRRAQVELKIVHQHDNVETLKRAVAMGAGVAILPLPSVQKEVTGKILQAVPLAGEDWKRPLAILRRRGSTANSCAEHFVEVLQSTN
jgi:DNA-binding transcriptional LysR family regulator